ncbi:MAG: zinc ribbon domain-containing protein [Gemmatimonadota bacterium]
MILFEALAAGVVGVALLWLVLQPLVLPGVVVASPAELPDPEETPRGQALLALKEIEFDRATGKLSDEDYAALHTRYTASALAALAAAPGAEDRVEAMIAEHAAQLDGPSFCSACGTRLPAGARFCPQCRAVVH